MTSGLVLGLITGLTTGMLAVGIVLVYKAGRFVNLAHGQLGTLSAVLLASLVLDRGWSWWVAFPVVVALGALIGVVVERLAVRRLRGQRRGAITYLLVTLGIGQLLLSFAFVPAVAPDKTSLFRQQYPLPFTGLHRIAGTDLTGAHLMILVVVPLTIGALAAFLRYSTLGKSIRAAASNPDAARLCGISVNRVNAVTWGLAGALSAVTAVLLAPGQSVLNPATLGPGLLLRSLGAAAIGGFVSIPAAMVGGVLLGIVEQVTLSWTSSGSDAELAVFVTVVLILVIAGRRISSAADNDDVTEDRPPVAVPPGVADRFVVRRHRSLLGLAALASAVVIPLLPYFDREANRFSLVIVLVLATVGIGLTMLLGWAGQVSLGHFALLGVGGYLASKLGEAGRSLPLVLLAAGAFGAVVMTVIGLPALRLRGLTLAVTTLGFAVVAPSWLFAQPWFGSEGRSVAHVPDLGLAGAGTLRTQLSIYYATLALLAVTAVGAGALRRAQPGRLIVAARDNSPALASFGVTPSSIKAATLALSGFIAATAGVMWGLAWDNVSADLVQPSQSLAILAIPVVGGLGSIAGAIAGAVLVYAPTFFIAPELHGLLGEFGENPGLQLLIAGSGLVFIPLAYPGGVAGVADRLWERYLRAIAANVHRWRPAEDAPPLEVAGACLDFGGVHALQDVHLHLQPGEIVGLIGPNGAGKTTLLSSISGQLSLKAGSVKVTGHDVTGLAPELRSGFGLGRSYQDARLFPGLTVAQAVEVALTRRHRSGIVSSLVLAPWSRAADREARREADEILATMGLTDWADTLTSDLSTGLRRLTDLAMQIAARPQVLLLDEPTAGVAQREGEALAPVLRRVRDELGCCILIVEHDMPLLMGLCDRIYAMEAGQVIAEGTPEQVRSDPVVIASYLGTTDVAVERSGKRRSGKREASASTSRRVLRATPD